MTDDVDRAAAALRAELAEVLDLDAGLAGVRRAALARLTHSIAPVLDMDAGLDEILRGSRRRPAPRRRTALGGFADRVAALPLQDRLTVRTWLPHHELEELSAVARLCLALDFDVLLDVLLDAPAHTLDHAVALVRAEIDDHARGLLPAPATCTDPVLRAAVDRTGDLIAAVTRDLTTAEGAGEVRQAVAGARRAVDALRRHLAEIRQLAFVHTRRLPIHIRRRAHVAAFCVAMTSDREDDREDGRVPLVDRELIAAVEAIDTALTDLTGSDLTSVDLTGIPLTGLRWSARTRWPPEMAAPVRRSSVEILPGRYEIRPGGVGVDGSVDARG